MLNLAADLDLLQRSSHRVQVRLYTRAPVGGDWVPLRVVDGATAVTYGRAGDVPGRTLTATVLLDLDDNTSVLEAPDHADDLLYAPLSIFGSWVKAEQVVYRYDGSEIVIPWGVYRLDSYRIDQLAGAVQISCSDAWQQVEERALIQLGMGRITNGQLYGARITTALQEVFVGTQIPPWWSALFDFGGVADRAYSGVGWTQTESRPEMVKALAAAWAPGWTIICPRTGPAFKMVQPGASDAVPVKAGAWGNLVGDFVDEVDRADFFNEVAVTYSVERNLPGGRLRTEQRRAVAQYLDAWEELRADGPFGYVTRDAQSMDVEDKTSPATADANARTLAAAAIGTSLTQTRPISFTTGPVYALEQGDYVSLQTQVGGPILYGTLIAATIPLDASGGDWQLQIEATKTLDPAVSASSFADLDVAEAARDNLDWIALKPSRTIDLDKGRGADTVPGKGVGKSWRGWTVGGDKTLRGGAVLVVTSAGGNVVLQSTDAWNETNKEHRYRAFASITGGVGTFDARVVIRWNNGSRAGAWTRITKGKGGTLVADSDVITASASRLSMRVETRGMTTNEQLRMNSAGMQYAKDQVVT
jgi:hypothetical protein